MTERDPCKAPTPEPGTGGCGEDNEVTAEEVAEEEAEEEEVTMAELELLKKLEEANRLIECDTKSLSCLSVAASASRGAASASGHSRSPSLASQISVQSGEAVTPLISTKDKFKAPI